MSKKHEKKSLIATILAFILILFLGAYINSSHSPIQRQATATVNKATATFHSATSVASKEINKRLNNR